jgi:uncharacterized membrane protein
MYNNSFFVRFGRYGNGLKRFASHIGGWTLIAPGLSLILFGLAILIWPELLAYMVAGLLIVAGATLAAWGWRIAQTQKHMQRQMQNGTVYREQAHYSSVRSPYDRF